MTNSDWPSWLARPPSVDELCIDDGEPMESQRHVLQMTLLMESLELAWADRNDFFVGGNMFLYFSALQAKKNDFRGPDVFVVLGTERRERKAWVVWEEDGKGPDVIIELLSDSTAQIDRGEKKRIYGSVLHVPEYFLFDPFTAELEGHALAVGATGYEPIQPSGDGRLPSRKLGLVLGTVAGRYRGVEAPWLRWLTPEGQVLATGEEAYAKAERQRADAERQRADAERQRAEAERRLAAYELRFGKLPDSG